MFNIYPDANSDAFRRTHFYNVDNQYLETMGMELVSGDNFSKDQEADSLSTIINETAARLFGLGNDAVGKVITLSTDNFGGKKDLKIVGVVKDFHFNTLYQPIEPMFMLNRPNSGLIIRAVNSDLAGLISGIQKLWNDFNTDEPFSYTVLNESYRNAYTAESNLRSVLRLFTFLTIFVALIGLFGLVTFTTEQRIKEIGVRKVLGSSVPQIISMLTRDFLKLVCFSFLLAFPVAFYLVDRWLQEFAYRIDTPWWVFIVAAIITVGMALATISLRSIKAAMANPVEALRSA
jgi:putative ABC transport system permease protein